MATPAVAVVGCAEIINLLAVPGSTATTELLTPYDPASFILIILFPTWVIGICALVATPLTKLILCVLVFTKVFEVGSHSSTVSDLVPT